ncbi:MAG: class I SAM-dependent methyltransferase [Anaerolineae bacterium]|jgi:SAM-dependent methyltransferase|nr:class I SAM-dependent methyltransferase [Anaerolineae bacterium]
MTQSTAFYDALAPMFDVMTDWDARLAAEGPFLRAQLDAAGAHRVLDAACGSGGHALWLARQGYEVTGADVSPVMINLARQKASAASLAVEFFVADLANLHPANLHPSTAFDAVLCLGNSLPHLLTQADLAAALRGMASVLRPGGLLILQNLNYDLRWQKQPRWFAAQGGELDGQPVLVWRFADYDVPAGRIAFHIALFRQGERDWKVDVHTTPQRPLFRGDLLDGLTAAGFGDVQAYGRMTTPSEPFDAEKSADLVVTARKTIA